MFPDMVSFGLVDVFSKFCSNMHIFVYPRKKLLRRQSVPVN